MSAKHVSRTAFASSFVPALHQPVGKHFTPFQCTTSSKVSATPPGLARVHMSNTRDPSHQTAVSRRSVLHLLSTAALLPFVSSIAPSLADDAFATYKGPISLGFSFAYPTAWTVKKKPIRTHLSEVIVTDPSDASTAAGIVVDTVKIDSIDKFGTPDVVAQKVVDVENKKESVTSATISSAKSVSVGGLTYYILDYVVDSSRGIKRYLAKVTVTGNQLYVLTAQAKVDKFEGDTSQIFAKMLDSFTVTKQYL